MPRAPRPLPAALPPGPFTVEQARAVGVDAARLRRADLERVRPGVHRRRPDEPAEAPARPPAPSPGPGMHPLDRLAAEEVLRLAALALRFEDATASGLTAARAAGLWLPARLREDRRLQLTRPPGASVLAEDGVVTRRAHLAPADVVRCPSGPPRTSPARTWRDLAGTLTRDELVVLGDWLVRSSGPGRTRGLCAVEELRARAAERGGRHAVVAREAAVLVRDGAHSPPETELRLALLAAGLPEPELQIEERDPSFSPWHPATADLGWRRWRVVLQYEGAGHDDPAQVRRDTQRDAVFLRRDVLTIRASASDRWQGFAGTVELARHALLRAGWRPDGGG